MTIPTSAEALRWMEIVASVAALLGTFELLAVRDAWRDDGVWRWETLARELPWLRGVLAYRPFCAVLALRVVAALFLTIGGAGLLVAFTLWVTSLLVNVRFRGTYNGGSDMMLMIVLSSVVVARAVPTSEGVQGAAVVYVGAQGVLSYWIAGFVKLANRGWRCGEALRSFLDTPHFGAPRALRTLVAGRATAVVASWGVIVFECAAPVALVDPRGAVAFVVVALVFHAATVVAFGLNRFLLTWSATWPAMIVAAARVA